MNSETLESVERGVNIVYVLYISVHNNSETAVLTSSKSQVVIKCVSPERFILHFYLSPGGQDEKTAAIRMRQSWRTAK